jgi:hypothetical protein
MIVLGGVYRALCATKYTLTIACSSEAQRDKDMEAPLRAARDDAERARAGFAAAKRDRDARERQLEDAEARADRRVDGC